MNYNLDELLVLIKELTDIYTSKESTSITYEAAQQLMGAVFLEKMRWNSGIVIWERA